MTVRDGLARVRRPRAGRELFAFTLVGMTAMLVHFLVVSAIVPLGLTPLIANVIGFGCALGVSFAGHERWSFPASSDRSRLVALRRFTLVAVTGFVANETLYFVLLRFTPLDYHVALVIVLGAIAFMTFCLSKYWAFAA